MIRFLVILGLAIVNQSYGQYLIKGIVYDNEGVPMPGVSVIEYRSDANTVTNANGEFTLSCSKPQQTIVFSFVGFKPQEVLANVTEPTTGSLQPDIGIKGGAPMICIFYDRHSKIGMGSGLRYTPFGFRIENYTPYLLSHWLHLTTGVEWRTNNTDNRYINVFLRRYEIIRSGRSEFSAFGEMKEIQTAAVTLKEFSIAPDVTFRRFRLSIGYTRQIVTENEIYSSGHGTYAALYAYVFGHLGIDLRTKHVLGNFQPDFRIAWDFNKPDITVGFGYERMRNLSELTGSVQYRLSY